MMNNINKIRRKLALNKAIFNKIPIKTVISFFKINLNGHKHFVTFHSSHRVHHLLSYNNIMMNGMTQNKARLVRGNNFIQKRVNSINNHLSNNFIDDITQSNRTELRSKFRLINFRNSNNQSIINGRDNKGLDYT